jgi:uroporphyrinogen decarboxylase
MTPRETVLAQINHETTDPVPFTLYFEGDVEERLNQHYGNTTWREKLPPYIISCGGFDRRRSDPISDTHNRDLFGSVWRTDLRPFHLEEPGLKTPSLEGYDFPDAKAFENPKLKETAEMTREEQPDSFTTIGMGWGLWETYWGIRGFEDAMMDCVAEPDFFAEVLDRLTDLYLAQVEQCADVQADAIMFGDDWGEQRGVMIGPDRWREFMKPRYARIYEAVHAQGKLTISHCCGSVADIMPDIIEIGLDVLESVQPEAAGMNPYELKARWGDTITFWGCLGSQSTIPFGTPATIHEEVARLKHEMGKDGGYILAPAKALQPETPTENAVAVYEAFTSRTDLKENP